MEELGKCTELMLTFGISPYPGLAVARFGLVDWQKLIADSHSRHVLQTEPQRTKAFIEDPSFRQSTFGRFEAGTNDTPNLHFSNKSCAKAAGLKRVKFAK